MEDVPTIAAFHPDFPAVHGGNIGGDGESQSVAAPLAVGFIRPIKALENADIRFNDVCEKDEMLTAVYSALKI